MNESTVNRVKRELAILGREIGGQVHNRMKMGLVPAGGRQYLGVIIENLAVNPRRFGGAKAVRAMLLLPAEYPRLPPLGVYVNRQHEVASSHFVGKGYHGAPTLVDEGWYWFCHGVGGFDAVEWKPAALPEDGHNLATVVAAARCRMNAAG
ncbi:MAG: hypothetical protein HGB35_00325 [Geobacteraceae bacterium]|nr:hypothetical protein [Geobacteraceae bacterium]